MGLDERGSWEEAGQCLVGTVSLEEHTVWDRRVVTVVPQGECTYTTELPIKIFQTANSMHILLQ